MDRWRLIVQPKPQTGRWNMAVDEAIARQTALGVVPPTVRFYAWQPACVSLGRHQPVAEIDLAACRRDGIDVVRRPTGGRAILHTDELTYSVAGPADHPLLRGNVLDVYLRLSRGLLLGLQQLGVAVDKAPGETRPPPDVSAVCFEVPSAYEIIDATGRKLIGSAQTRRRDWVLQHGALPLEGDVSRLTRYLALPAAEREKLRCRLLSRATTLREALGRPVRWEEAATALADGFRQALGIQFSEETVSEAEIALARAIQEQRYGDEAWTTHR